MMHAAYASGVAGVSVCALVRHAVTNRHDTMARRGRCACRVRPGPVSARWYDASMRCTGRWAGRRMAPHGVCSMANPQNRPSSSQPSSAAPVADTTAPVAALPGAAVQPEAPKPQPRMAVQFHAVDASKAVTTSGQTLCRGEIMGCFVADNGEPLRVVVSGFALSLRSATKDVAVFMPGNFGGKGGPVSRNVGPAQITLDEPISIGGRTVYTADDKRGVADVKRLETALISAWGDACADRDHTYSQPWLLSIGAR